MRWDNVPDRPGTAMHRPDRDPRLAQPSREERDQRLAHARAAAAGRAAQATERRARLAPYAQTAESPFVPVDMPRTARVTHQRARFMAPAGPLDARTLEREGDKWLRAAGLTVNGTRRAKRASHNSGTVGRIRTRVAESQSAKAERQRALTEKWERENRERLARREAEDALRRVIGGARLER